MDIEGSKIKVKKGVYEGVVGIITTSLTIPLSNIWPLVENKDMPSPACSIVLYAIELENGTYVSLPLDCFEFIDA